MHNIYFIRLKILPRNLVHYTGVWMTLNENVVGKAMAIYGNAQNWTNYLTKIT